MVMRDSSGGGGAFSVGVADCEGLIFGAKDLPNHDASDNVDQADAASG